ncbi:MULTISPECIES: TrbM/KikA/MpfK family conjugal transfer protein [Enterobacterales]|uniref:TrbM/KikA/MpfK family conjugal transfer protein n=1 Tax=Enterobacterales TaxID=91347 RepID=UPI001A2775BE|nr:TrbM/KikA/MpfK family conjugal transfer protein [Proteus mirabilis]EJF7775387.1 conjugal transfer protein [Salmonella enterica subsp. enterica]MCH7458387.1 conjugal transfer protein [Escherichia coli]HAU5617153.1 conjugal transfer protein [Morganella morganii]UIL98481.1 conjugal transfer protein [Escherichia coli]WOS22926.1 TrbM/KikA/MpfK family conjugal transfer protein [Proteus mirabilis]
MNKFLFILLPLLLTPALSQAEPEVLTGDVRLSCEAILCLSSGTRPGECSPSLSRYFGIHKKKWSDTIKARKNFLKLCPAAEEKGMPDLVNAIANGAGRCDAAYLNKFLYEEKREQKCRSRGKEEDCWYETYYRIKNELPNYCRAYVNHEWTDLDSSLHYQGKMEWVKKESVAGWNNQGGQWVD